MNKTNSNKSKKQHQSLGFSLLEVLVAIVIVAVGLLGYAGLQIQSLQSSTDSYQRDRATHLADDMISRLKANRIAALARQYDQPAAGSLAVQDPNCLLATGCTNSQSLAGDDLFYWNNAVTGGGLADRSGITPVGLVNGQGVVCIDSTPDDFPLAPSPANPLCDGVAGPNGIVYAIKIWWGPDNDANNAGTLNDGNSDGIPDFFYVTSHQP